jgi:glycosyltransferase involved in cell wall biosynthesis
MRIIARTNVGGPALQASVLLRGMPAGRFEQRLYAGSLAAGEADFLQLRAPDVTARCVPSLSRRVKLGDDLQALRVLAAEMRDFRPHIVHTHTTKAGVAGRLAALMTGVPALVHTFHGHVLHGYFPGPVSRAVVVAESVLARRTDRIIAVGSQVRDELLAAGIGRRAQYAIVPPGTSLGPLPHRLVARRTLGLPPDCPVVAYVGRLTKVKRPDRLLAVAREVRAAMPATRFLVCGHGDLAAGVEAAGRDPASGIVALGWRADVETVYAAADLVLLTSDNEGMPVSLIEAAMAGVPAVATDVGSVAEVVEHGITGLLTPPSSGALAQAVLRLLADVSVRAGMGMRARSRSTAQFGPERLVRDVAAVYESIAMARGWWAGASQPPAAEEVTR